MTDKKTSSIDGKQANSINYRKPNQRRKALKAMAAGGGAVTTAAMLPEKWAKPIVDSIVLPAHAQTSQISDLFNACQVNNWLSNDTSNTPENQGPFNEGATTVAIGNSDDNDHNLSGITATTTMGGVTVNLQINSSGGTPITEGNSFNAVADPTNGVATFPDVTVEGSNTNLGQGDSFLFTFAAPNSTDCVVRIDVGPGT